MCKCIVHCTLIDLYVRDYERSVKKYSYTLNPNKAKVFANKAEAKATILKLNPVWHEHMEIVKV